MEKIRIKKVSHALISASLRGLAIFAVFGMALYAYAITYPTSEPGPVTGVVGLYAGKTTSLYDGNGAAGYVGAQAACEARVAGSHVCTPMEIINSYNHGDSEDLVGPSLASETDPLWLNSGAPAYYSSVANDCLGWTSDGNLYGQPIYGSVWFTAQEYGMMTFCNQSLRYACCK